MSPATSPNLTKYSNACGYPSTREDSDLCAQWVAATAARKSAEWIPYQFGLGIAEAAGILLSLVISTLAAIAAFKALRSSQRAEERQNRAYVFPEIMFVSPRTSEDFPEEVRGIPASGLTIKNSGQTPAYRLIHWGEILLHPTSDEASLTVPPLAPVHMMTVPPGGTVQKYRNLNKKLSRKEITAFKRGDLAIYVYGRIEYDDSFGKRRYTNYRFSFTGRWPLPDQATLNYCIEGNDSD